MRMLVRSATLATSLTLLLLAAPAAAVNIDWVTIGDPGNAADTTGFGAVADAYRIARTEVTNAQYTEFLNAKAAADPFQLYNTLMSGTHGGIVQSGSPGSYSYSTVAGRANAPVNYVSFYDTLRFANWMNNGQGGGDTETGAYTLLGGSLIPTNGTTLTRNAGADIFLTSEDEWYKAAYYDALTNGYTSAPFADGFGGLCHTAPGPNAHSANCFFATGNTIDVGSYTASASASGTFDQGGNVREWNETIHGSNRSVRGGSWRDAVGDLNATSFTTQFNTVESDQVGFRVASLVPIPEPGTGTLLGVGLVALAGRRRARA